MERYGVCHSLWWELVPSGEVWMMVWCWPSPLGIGEIGLSLARIEGVGTLALTLVCVLWQFSSVQKRF